MAPLLVAMTPLVKSLFAGGLNLLGNAVLTKGREKVEELIGSKLPDTGTALTAEQIFALKELEFTHEEKLLEFAVKQQELSMAEQKMYLEDVGDARDLGKSLAHSDSKLSQNIVPVLAIISIIGGMAMIVAGVESDARMAGLSIVMMPLAYYFGTSQGSKQKQDQIHSMLGGKK